MNCSIIERSLSDIKSRVTCAGTNTIKLTDNKGNITDEVRSYFGMRDIKLGSVNLEAVDHVTVSAAH